MLLLFGLVLAVYCLVVFPTLRCIVFHPFLVTYYGIRDLYEYTVHKGCNNAPYGQIMCYIADSSTSFGCGKTLSATDALVSLFRQFDGKKV